MGKTRTYKPRKKKASFDWKSPLGIFSIVGASLLALMLGMTLYLYIAAHSSPIDSGELKIRIPNNTSISRVVKIMNAEGALTPAWFFELYAKYYSFNHDATISAGYYKFKHGTSNIEILRSLFSGDNMLQKKITFPEGISLRRFAAILNKELGIDTAEFMKLASNRKLLKKYGIDAVSAEGYLMPATYNFFADITASEVIRILLETQNELWINKFADKAALLGKTRHEVMTMASIVEAETPTNEERPRVAGVYYNRLRIGMLLQSDPTVQYAVGEKRRLSYNDLQSDNPYNTYKFKGMPPGPINSPGETAIAAALEPEKHAYIYFVAVGDGSGKHNFARSFDEHKRYVALYRRNKK